MSGRPRVSEAKGAERGAHADCLRGPRQFQRRGGLVALRESCDGDYCGAVAAAGPWAGAGAVAWVCAVPGAAGAFPSVAAFDACCGGGVIASWAEAADACCAGALEADWLCPAPGMSHNSSVLIAAVTTSEPAFCFAMSSAWFICAAVVAAPRTRIAPSTGITVSFEPLRLGWPFSAWAMACASCVPGPVAPAETDAIGSSTYVRWAGTWVGAACGAALGVAWGAAAGAACGVAGGAVCGAAAGAGWDAFGVAWGAGA